MIGGCNRIGIVWMRTPHSGEDPGSYRGNDLQRSLLHAPTPPPFSHLLLPLSLTYSFPSSAPNPPISRASDKRLALSLACNYRNSNTNTFPFLSILGDVRMLLSSACNCLNFTVEKFKKMQILSNSGGIQPINAVKNPLDRLDGNRLLFYRLNIDTRTC